jgi:hypothetical protein
VLDRLVPALATQIGQPAFDALEAEGRALREIVLIDAKP